MKKFIAMVCSAVFIIGMGSFAVEAAKPVDNDGDGYNTKRDCNDNDVTVWNLNSCGECLPEPPGGCGGTTCTDNDGDTYATEGGSCGLVDCDDTVAATNPGASEVCDDQIDNNCNGSVDSVDEGCVGASNRDVIVMATNDLGMHCACPGAEYFLLLPPFNTLRAQVIERGLGSPVVLDDPNDIRVEYNVVENTDANLQADDYYSKWIEMMPKYGFGPAIVDNKIVGLTGATLDGEMHAKTGEGWWEVVGVPAFPDVSNASSQAEKVMIDPLAENAPNRNPYLTGNVKVFDQTTNQLLAETNTVVPVAFGGCCNCHLQVTADAGLEPTPENSFNLMGTLHERDSGINISQIDPDGDGTPGPVRCSVCHLDPAMGESTPPGGYALNNASLPVSQYTFSDVLHRWHVENETVLTYEPDLATSCYNCHPGNGVDCYRGHHINKDGSGPGGELWCTDCHGDLHQRVAEGQLEAPWSDTTLPSCNDCHRRTGEGGGYLHTGIFGEYLNSRGHKNDKILCSTCHGAPHALYPSTLAKDNEQNINLQGLANPIGVCDTCHTGKSSKYGKPQH